MRKITTALAIIAVLFAAGAIIIAFGSTVLLKHQTRTAFDDLPSEEELLEQARTEFEGELREEIEAEIMEKEVEEAIASEKAPELDQRTKLSSLGVEFKAPEAWGELELNCTSGIASYGEGHCMGSFTGLPGLAMTAIAPLTPAGTGAHGAVLVDYRESDNGYYVMTNQGWEAPVPDHLLNGEIETLSKSVLVINRDTEELSLFPTTGTRSALHPVDNVYLKSIMWSADASVDRSAFRAFLESLEITTPELPEL